MYKLAGIALVLALLSVFSWVIAPTLVAVQWRHVDASTRRKIVAIQRAGELILAAGLFVYLATR